LSNSFSRLVDIAATVSDDGTGIDQDLLPHLFERFVRGDKSRSRQAGSFGLDLSITVSIVAAHDGSIPARSDSDATTFTIRLPTVPVGVQYATSK
jgi:two-component system, OmpR family, sensor histidine kinase TrcS